MNINNFKNDLHGIIVQIGNKIYDERITEGQIGPINASKIKLTNEMRYENNQRIQYKLNLLKERYNCEIEYLKYRYTEIYYKEKKRIEKLFDDGLLIMVIFIIQKLDYDLQSECKSLQDQLRHDMEGDFKILLNCVLEQKANELTKLIEKQVEAGFQKDLQLVNKMWLYCMRNIEVHLNASVCEETMKSIHILCAESATANLKRWQLRKANQTKIAEIKKYIKLITQWKPQLQVCPNIEIGRKHFRRILKKYQKYFNFYYSAHEHFSFEEIAEDTNSIDENADHNLNTTPSMIFAAFDSKAQYCCTDESKVFVTTETDVIPISKICADQTAQLENEELKHLKKFPPPDKIENNWTLCEMFEENANSAEFLDKRAEELKDARDNEEMPNLFIDLLHMIDPEKLSLQMLKELHVNWKARSLVPGHKNVNIHKQITELLKKEIEHKLNNQHVLNVLNLVLGPAYEAVKMKRISALSYLKDSITVIKNRNNELNSVFIETETQNMNLVSEPYPISLKMTQQEYMDSFLKLPPYLFPQRQRPPFDSIYKKTSDTELRELILNEDIATQGDGAYFIFNELYHKKDVDRMKHRRTSILKSNPREKIQPLYKMTVRTAIHSLAEDTSVNNNVNNNKSNGANKFKIN